MHASQVLHIEVDLDMYISRFAGILAPPIVTYVT